MSSHCTCMHHSVQQFDLEQPEKKCTKKRRPYRIWLLPTTIVLELEEYVLAETMGKPWFLWLSQKKASSKHNSRSISSVSNSMIIFLVRWFRMWKPNWDDQQCHTMISQYWSRSLFKHESLEWIEYSNKYALDHCPDRWNVCAALSHITQNSNLQFNLFISYLENVCV